jgi:hypothetical protein
MKGSRLIATVVVLLFALVCFTSTPVFSLDPWDADASSEGSGGNGNDGDGSADPTDDPDPNTDEGMDNWGGSFGPDWFTSLVYELTFEFVTNFLGADDESPDTKREVVEESSGNATAQ